MTLEKNLDVKSMKAVILAAGIGSRIRSISNNSPKSLLKVGDLTILEMMISHIQDNGINEIIFVLGYLQEQIKVYVGEKFPKLNARFVINHKYAETNTGYSLMLTEDLIMGASFIKFDADVVFDKRILKKLIECEHANCLCVDKNIKLDAEGIKIIVDDNNQILKANKTVLPKDAVGESIGIEKIDGGTAILLFKELKTMMEDSINNQAYIESAYERLIKKNVPFYALDITGLNWVEIDTRKDFIRATNILKSQR
jgi:choline kinase